MEETRKTAKSSGRHLVEEIMETDKSRGKSACCRVILLVVWRARVAWLVAFSSRFASRKDNRCAKTKNARSLNLFRHETEYVNYQKPGGALLSFWKRHEGESSISSNAISPYWGQEEWHDYYYCHYCCGYIDHDHSNSLKLSVLVPTSVCISPSFPCTSSFSVPRRSPRYGQLPRTPHIRLKTRSFEQ